MKILIAPNAFKNSLSAEEAAIAIEEGLYEGNPKLNCQRFPIGDGGDGTGKLLRERLKASTIHVIVHDPLGRKIESIFGFLIDKKTAIIEMADASGLRLVKPAERDPLISSSYGTGELIKCALDLHATAIILCIGGTATVDGGIGILEALGVKFLFRSDHPGRSLPYRMTDLFAVDLASLDTRLKNTSIKVLCDVLNPLIGEQGAARVFGPQKGATPEQVGILENGLMKLTDVISDATGKNIGTVRHGGAGGGAASILSGLVNAVLVNGIGFFLDITDFNHELKYANVLITGEGSLDDQSLQGKGPIGVASRAKESGLKVVGMAGSIPVSSRPALQKYFDELIVINRDDQSIEEAMALTKSNLRDASRELGKRL